MPRAVRFTEYGDVNVLKIEEVEEPIPGEGQVVVAQRASSVNPGEIAIREGEMAEQFPTTFPSGEGSDVAGTIAVVGRGVDGFAVGDPVAGWSDDRAAHADFVLLPADHLAHKPDAVAWNDAGALFVAGATAWAAVRAVGAASGDVVAVSSAAGGVGSLAIQLAKNKGATVIGIAGPANHDWLRSMGVTPVAYGDGLADRLREAAPDGIDAFIDTHGEGYVQLALDLGVAKDRIDTIIDFDAVQKLGVKGEGSQEGSKAEVVAELLDDVAAGRLVIPIAATYPLDQIRDAYTELAKRHTRGKIVLTMQ